MYIVLYIVISIFYILEYILHKKYRYFKILYYDFETTYMCNSYNLYDENTI